MQPKSAEKLLSLLKAIDTDHPKDFVDLVCEARDALPEGTEEELASWAYGCTVEPFSSRCCEKGTKGCEARHNGTTQASERDSRADLQEHLYRLAYADFVRKRGASSCIEDLEQSNARLAVKE